MNSRKIKEYRSGIEISDRQREIIIGSILGDGHLESVGRCYRLKIEHSYKQKNYVDWKYQELKSLVLSVPKLKKVATRVSYWFSTMSLPQLKWYYDKFRYRMIPQDIHQFLNPLALAIWFMDDGSVKSKQCKGLYLQTQSFRGVNLLRLQKALLGRYNIETTIAYDNRLYFPSKTSARKLCQILSGHIHPSMKYKMTY